MDLPRVLERALDSVSSSRGLRILGATSPGKGCLLQG